MVEKKCIFSWRLCVFLWLCRALDINLHRCFVLGLLLLCIFCFNDLFSFLQLFHPSPSTHHWDITFPKQLLHLYLISLFNFNCPTNSTSLTNKFLTILILSFTNPILFNMFPIKYSIIVHFTSNIIPVWDWYPILKFSIIINFYTLQPTRLRFKFIINSFLRLTCSNTILHKVMTFRRSIILWRPHRWYTMRRNISRVDSLFITVPILEITLSIIIKSINELFKLPFFFPYLNLFFLNLKSYLKVCI